MFMSRSRFTIGTILAVVAVAGVLLALISRREHLRRLASFHQGRSYIGAGKTPCTVAGKTLTAYIPTDERWWHYEMRYRMEAAARRPWWPFNPGPLPRDLPRRGDVRFFAE